MRQARWQDRTRVVDIISKTFADNPGVNWMFRKTIDSSKYLRRLASYVFIKCYNRKGVLLSNKEQGVALYYRADQKVFSLREFFYELYFALTAIGLMRISKVLRREAIRRSFRPKDDHYLYFWFLAVLPEAGGEGFELKNFLFEESDRLNLPIYLETSVERNKRVYEKIGFSTYHEWHDEKENIHFWFMKREPFQSIYKSQVTVSARELLPA